MPSQDRTEEATPRRRAEARRKGQVARSIEISSVAIMLAGFAIMNLTGAMIFGQISGLTKESLRLMAFEDLSLVVVSQGGHELVVRLLMTMAPLFTGLFVIGVGVNVLQTNVVFSLFPLKPDLGRLNPLNGLKRMFSFRSLFELAKSTAKIAIAGFIAYTVFRDKFESFLLLSRSDLASGVWLLVQALFETGWKAGGLLLVLAATDYFYQRRQFEKNLKMTREELKEEMKHYEGSPEVKARIRRMQRAFTRGRIVQNVLHADVVVTDPTELAVALEYDGSTMSAPTVTAKGQRLIAEQIKDIAKEHAVPIVENKPLARALFDTVEIGTEVPVALYQAVAGVLAFIYQSKNKCEFQHP